ncbi:MAG: 7-cyano-7-deazaguanine synthase QueC [Desulfovibrionaceae bacterium]|nr:7-cyano-7-deazaguanine synthase QueC [Desulfovibrionaceae bacterium]
MQKAVVLFSGGQDSSTCLLYALTHYAHVWTLGISYGQKHSVELACRKTILDILKQDRDRFTGSLEEDHVIDLKDLATLTDSALTNDKPIVMGANGLPTSFVPGRNVIFLSLAAALAYDRGADTIIAGMSQVDYSGYPDCREETLKSMTQTLSLGLNSPIHIEAPLMHLSKAATWALANELGGEWAINMLLEHTATCYRGVHNKRHAWGYGCGECPACVLRAKGYAEFRDMLHNNRLE